MRYAEKERKFFEQAPDLLAPLLLGKVLCRRLSGGRVLRYRITETEAYCGKEDFCYGSEGKKANNKSAVFYSTGVLCDYCSMLMISCCGSDNPSNVLIRGAQLLEEGGKAETCAGVTKLRDAFIAGEAVSDNNLLTSSEVWLEGADTPPCKYCCHERVRVESDRKWRFCLQGDE